MDGLATGTAVGRAVGMTTAGTEINKQTDYILRL